MNIFLYRNINELILLSSFFTAFILGNAALNIFIFLSTLYLILNYKKISLPKNINIYFILVFFLYLFFIGLLYDEVNTKNFSQIRFFFLVYFFFFLRTQGKNFDNNLKKISNFFIIVVSIDIIIQYFYLIDLFGFKLIDEIPTGPFENEVVGSFLSKVFFCTGSYIFLKSGNLNNFRIIIIVLAFISIILSTERMAFFHASVVLISLVLFELLIKNNFKKKIIIFLSLLIFLSLIGLNEKFKVNFIAKSLNQFGFYNISYKIIENTQKIKEYNSKIVVEEKYINNKYPNASRYAYLNWGFENEKNENPHKKLFNSAVEIFKENIFFGSGVKSFNKECKKLNQKENKNWYLCSTHPHNIHIQILSETGIISYVLFILIIFSVIYSSFKNFLKTKEIYQLSYLIGLIILILPLPSGNMFGTWPGSFFWFILSLNLYDQKKF